MAWTKSPPQLVARFDEVTAGEARLERRQMFGYPCAFVNGNLGMGLFEDTFMLRLGERDRGEIIARFGGGTFEPIPGKPMREYVTLPADILDDDDRLRAWVARSIAYAAALPPKEKKPAGGRKRKAPG